MIVDIPLFFEQTEGGWDVVLRWGAFFRGSFIRSPLSLRDNGGDIPLNGSLSFQIRPIPFEFLRQRLQFELNLDNGFRLLRDWADEYDEYFEMSEGDGAAFHEELQPLLQNVKDILNTFLVTFNHCLLFSLQDLCSVFRRKTP